MEYWSNICVRRRGETGDCQPLFYFRLFAFFFFLYAFPYGTWRIEPSRRISIWNGFWDIFLQHLWCTSWFAFLSICSLLFNAQQNFWFVWIFSKNRPHFRQLFRIVLHPLGEHNTTTGIARLYHLSMINKRSFDFVHQLASVDRPWWIDPLSSRIYIQ